MTWLIQNRITLAVAIAVPCAVALWLLTAAAGAVSSTFVFVALLVVATALIGLNTWNNGQATGSMAQVIREADITPLTKPAAVPTERTGAARWMVWESRDDALAYTGRVRALLALSIAVTGALLLYAWLT